MTEVDTGGRRACSVGPAVQLHYSGLDLLNVTVPIDLRFHCWYASVSHSRREEALLFWNSISL
jgi:hypothetical protein